MCWGGGRGGTAGTSLWDNNNVLECAQRFLRDAALGELSIVGEAHSL